MQSRRANTQAAQSLRTSPLLSVLRFSLALLTASTAIQLLAQAPPPPEESPYTLHVYTRRLEIPTLVLPSPSHPLPPIDAQSFTISLDSGPHFHPSHIRLEGNDAITLAILLDVSGEQPDLLAAFRRSMPLWVARSLRPQDHVSIYAIDCSLLQTDNYQAPDPTVLGDDFNVAITSPLSHGKKTHGACGNSIHLWDSMNAVMQQLAQLPGRRVLLVVSNGYDGKSVLKWSTLRSDAIGSNVTVFALTSQAPAPTQSMQSLNSLTQRSGGLYLRSTADALPNVLAYFIDMLRGRYILDFPMPANFTSGTHLIDVTLNQSDALIRPSGIALPEIDPAIANDPTTIPSNNSNAPVMGNHRPADPNP